MLPLRWRMSRGFHLPAAGELQPYYIQWSSKPAPRGEGWDSEHRDGHGVLLIAERYKPVDIAQYALFEYQRMVDGCDGAQPAFLAQAEYLATAQRADGGYPYPDPAEAYAVGAGWLSAMAQGQAASVLLRAWKLTGEARFRDAASRALEPLRYDVTRGGVSFIRSGDVFFEEVASTNPCHILNGHLYAAFGLWEAGKLGIVDRELHSRHDGAVDTLQRWIADFEADGWSYYDLATDGAGRRHLASLWYHQFHIAQLRVYAAMVGSGVFGATADRWERALGDWRSKVRVWGYGTGVMGRALLRRLGVGAPSVWTPIQGRAR